MVHGVEFSHLIKNDRIIITKQEKWLEIIKNPYQWRLCSLGMILIPIAKIIENDLLQFSFFWIVVLFTLK